MSTNNYNQAEEDISVYRASEDDFTLKSAQHQLPVSTTHGAITLTSDSNDCTIVDEIKSSDENKTTVSEQFAAKEEIKARAHSPSSDISDSSEVENSQSEDDISVYIVSKDDFSPAQQSAQYQLPVSTVYGASALTSDSNDCTVVDEKISDDKTSVSEHVAVKEDIKLRPPSPSSEIQDSSEVEKQTPDTEISLYGNKSTIFLAVFVRSLLIVHNIVTAWRVTKAYNDDIYWLIVLTNLALIVEGVVVIVRRGGIEYSWWCPCFLVYLPSVILSIWLLKLDQHHKFVASQQTTVTTSENVSTLLNTTVTNASTYASTIASTPISSMSSTVVTYSTEATSAITTLISSSVATSPSTSAISSTISLAVDTFSTMAASLNTTATGQTEATTPNKSISKTTGKTVSSTKEPKNTTLCPTNENKEALLNKPPDSDTWVILVSNSIVYLIVFSRWLLPRGQVSRDRLADLLLVYLAMTSDIMELLAFVDDMKIRGNLKLTSGLLAVWSISFIQFIPIPNQKKPRRRLTRLCGEQLDEFILTCLSIFLQDFPFFVIRLYIAIDVNLITYSLIFFLLKNIISMLLCFYRLVIIVESMPFCEKS